MGRKRIPTNEKLQMMSVALPPALKKRIKQIASQSRRSVSRVARELIEQALDTKTPGPVKK